VTSPDSVRNRDATGVHSREEAATAVVRTDTRPVGHLLRDWRRRRRLSQLDLSIEADVSTRHLSFLETGRARPSRAMVLRLADQLDVPLRERNHLLVAAGFAPLYQERPIDAPEMAAVREALHKVLGGHEPYPALVVDRGWNLVLANAAVGVLLDGVSPALLEPPVNVLRVALHPEGLAPRVINFAEVREHLLSRLARQVALTGDPATSALYAELRTTAAAADTGGHGPGGGDIVLPVRLRAGDQVLNLFSTVTTFGTALDITLAELAIEAFFPADHETAAALGRAVRAAPPRAAPASARPGAVPPGS
jgi:transcriptional regulator with XRE-family HTH domain